MRKKKHKVFSINCEETDVHGVIAYTDDEVGDFIVGDISNYPDEKEFHYIIVPKMMTGKQIANLPEYEG